MEEELSKFPIKKQQKTKQNKKTLKRQSKCHIFVKQVCFSYGESPRTPPLEGTSLHRRNISVERPWGILSLFTTTLPLWVKSSHQSRCYVRVTYTGINSMHSQKTKQRYIRSAKKNRNWWHAFSEDKEAYIRSAKKDRTRKKSATEEDPQKNKKNEPFE